MKFRAKLVDINCIGQFLKIFTTVGKIAKLSTLRLSETQVVLTHNERAASGGTAMWCEVNQADFFDEYRIEGWFVPKPLCENNITRHESRWQGIFCQ